MRLADMVENLQLELLTSDPGDKPHGRIWKNTTEKRTKIADIGNVGKHILVNDENLIIGTSATASENVRMNRALNGLLQFLPANDETLEGNLSSSLAQLAARDQNVTLANLPAAGNPGRFLYVSDAKTPYIDDGEVVRSLYDLGNNPADAQNRIVLSSDTRQNLELIPRKENAVYFSTDEKILLVDDGQDLVNPATGASSGEALFTVESSLDDVDVTNHVLDNTAIDLTDVLGFNINYALQRRTLINGYRDSFFNTKLSDQAQYTDYQTNGAVYGFSANSTHLFMFGNFTDSGAATTRFFRAMELDGDPDQTYNNNASAGNKFSSTVYHVEPQADDKVIVVGDFENYDGVNNYHKLVRLEADGSLDNVFTANASNNGKFPAASFLYDAKVQPDGKILVAGSFQDYGGTTGRSGLIRLNADGTEDTAFNANLDGKINASSVLTVALQADGKIIIGGTFTNFNGSGINKVVRLNADGTHDTTLNVDEDISNIKKIVVNSSGDIFIAGVGLFKFNSVGVGYAEFNDSNPNQNATLDDVILDANEKPIAVGTFTYWEKGATVTTGLRGCARLELNGDLDLEFTKNAFNGTDIDVMTGVYGAFMFPDKNDFIFGGYFTRQVGSTGIDHVQAVKQDDYVYARQHQAGMATTLSVLFDDGTVSLYTEQGTPQAFNSGEAMANNTTVYTDIEAIVEGSNAKLRADVNAISKPSGIEHRVSGKIKTKTLVIK